MNPSWESLLVGVALLGGVAAYALFSGADFGGGIWDLLAGGSERGAAPRKAIEASLTPVWEANHVWIIFVFVLSWTAFPRAFSATMVALFVPLSLSLLGIFLRGLGFSFRHEASGLPTQMLTGALFASSSLLAPFFLGTVVGAIATGKVRVGMTTSPADTWTTATALTTGLLFVSACAYVGAVYLIGDCRRRGHRALERYFSRRALIAGVITGVIAGINMLLLHGSAPYLYRRLTGVALPFVAISVAAGVAGLILILLRRATASRLAAALAVSAVVAGWGVGQYPWLLPQSLSLSAGSAPPATLQAELVVLLLAGVLVGPAFVYLYWLQQHERLSETGLSEQPQTGITTATSRLTGPPNDARRHRLLTIVFLGAVVADFVRDARRGLHKSANDP